MLFIQQIILTGYIAAGGCAYKRVWYCGVTLGANWGAAGCCNGGVGEDRSCWMEFVV